MNFFSKTKNKGELTLVFDINSCSIGGALFLMNEKEPPKIIYSTREFLKVDNDLKVEDFLPTVIKSLRKVAGKICMKGLGKPKRIFCVLSSPWYYSQTRVVELHKNTPFIFNSSLVNDLIKKEINFAKEEYIKKRGPNSHDIVPIEVKTMNVKLNGYHILNPNNQKAKSLEISIFISVCEEIFLKKIEETISQHFNFKIIKFSSFLMSTFSIAKDMFINQDNFLLVNIGGEITDISMIKKNAIRDSISFPLGSNYLIRTFAKDTGLSIDEAKSFLSLHKDNHLSDKMNERFFDSISKLKKDWLKIFQESLNNLSHDISIPATMFITVDQNLADFFFEIIKTEQLTQYTLSESNFKIIFIKVDTLHGIVLFENDKINKDLFIIIESIYINHFLK